MAKEARNITHIYTSSSYITNSASPSPVWITVGENFLTKVSLRKTPTSASLEEKSLVDINMLTLINLYLLNRKTVHNIESS